LTASPAGPSSPLRRAPGNPVFWAGLLGLGAALLVGRQVLRPPAITFVQEPRPQATLPVYGTLPPIDLVDQEGRPFTRERLKGRIWITNFIFTSCPTVCPLLSQRMSALQTRLAGQGPGVQLASISVDPETDTPAVLKAYGARYQQDPARWTFLTGKPDAILSAVSDGFKIGVTREARPAADGKAAGLALVHGENFVLMDGEGRIRGYYHKDDAELDRLVADALRLLQGNA